MSDRIEPETVEALKEEHERLVRFRFDEFMRADGGRLPAVLPIRLGGTAIAALEFEPLTFYAALFNMVLHGWQVEDGRITRDGAILHAQGLVDCSLDFQAQERETGSASSIMVEPAFLYIYQQLPHVIELLMYALTMKVWGAHLHGQPLQISPISGADLAVLLNDVVLFTETGRFSKTGRGAKWTRVSLRAALVEAALAVGGDKPSMTQMAKQMGRNVSTISEAMKDLGLTLDDIYRELSYVEAEFDVMVSDEAM